MDFVMYQYETAIGTHVSPLLNTPPNPVSTPTLQVVTEHPLWASCIIHQTPTGYLFYIWSCICFNASLSSHPTPSFSHWVQKSVLYVCVSFATPHVGLLVPSFEVPYVCINTRYLSFSFWLTSLCIIGSRRCFWPAPGENGIRFSLSPWPVYSGNSPCWSWHMARGESASRPDLALALPAPPCTFPSGAIKGLP